ncbi:MAG: hypothetical protein RBR86_05785 [Pseudobdellovibrionaceae bacterium]|jgi:hypothetical protein|nr:hypothetical protein [Pseudobdellovibrionaceae bacterium]
MISSPKKASLIYSGVFAASVLAAVFMTHSGTYGVSSVPVPKSGPADDRKEQKAQPPASGKGNKQESFDSILLGILRDIQFPLSYK